MGLAVVDYNDTGMYETDRITVFSPFGFALRAGRDSPQRAEAMAARLSDIGIPATGHVRNGDVAHEIRQSGLQGTFDAKVTEVLGSLLETERPSLRDLLPPTVLVEVERPGRAADRCRP